MLHRLIIISVDKEKALAYSLLEKLDTPAEMKIVKAFNTSQDLNQMFRDFVGVNDIIVCFMTQQSQEFVRRLLTNYEDIIRQRALVVLSALLGGTCIKNDFFTQIPVVSNNDSIDQLAGVVANVVTNILHIDLKNPRPWELENLVRDVLEAYLFDKIYYTYSDHVDFGYDMMCSYNRDNEMDTEEENWLVEVKYSSTERFTIRNIEEMIMKDRSHYLPNHRVMLVTNGTLTSVVSNYIAELQRKLQMPIFIVDGRKLCILIAMNEGLMKNHFPYE